MDEDELRIRARKYETYTRLVAKDKADLDEATQIYHANILRIACKNLLKMEVVDTYLGLKNRARGSNMYSNFCRYDIRARRACADESLPMGQRWKNCSAIWRLLSREEKDAFDDPDHLSKLPNPYLELVLDTGEILPPCALPGTSGGKRSKFDAARWCRKIAVDMMNLGSSHGVEAMVVVVHPAKKKGRALVQAGSRLGEAFFDILAKRQNPLDEFLNFVKGHQSSCVIAGADVPVPKRARQQKAAKNRMENCKHAEGSWEKNRKPIREQLAFALYKASNGSCTTGWPGKDTVASLTDLRLSLRVDENPMGIGASEFCKPISNLRIGEQERILTALGEGWVHLVRHKTLDPTQPVGHVGEDAEGVDVANTTVTVGPIPAGEGVPKANKNSTQASGVKGKGKGKSIVDNNKNTGGGRKRKRTQASDEESTASSPLASDQEEEPDDDRFLDDDDFGMPAQAQSSGAGPSRTRAASEPSDSDEEEVCGPYVPPRSPGTPPRGFPRPPRPAFKRTLTRAAKRRRAANLGAPRNELGAQKGGGTQKKGGGTQKKGGGTQKKGGGTQKKGGGTQKKVGGTQKEVGTQKDGGTRKNEAQGGGGAGFKGPWRPKKIQKSASNVPPDAA
ncbi:hypothetical protein Pst134EA_022872 [Puccinia striiformis f. sp. tritici]|uniref:hypothetical protein n=1 Tax=Puccinia striiformis f. sp. tritici TaxID=168172 RepID=UPI0020084A65|nr:hypothetical protein Pst134EA_022872 [Puccinia striiformis f. sp. tritici]KAH9455404.1 hypothetical protein Pst134EA_022872 [Puccinia striiformis f. sp. tritici]